MCTRRCANTCAGYFLLSHIIIATAVLRGQSQETINERQRSAADGLDRRLSQVEHILEQGNLASRTSVLESDMYEVKWLARGVAGAVMVQLVLAGLGFRDKRRA